ncbi:MAG: hypothetical protein V1720_08610 [bacterium]
MKTVFGLFLWLLLTCNTSQSQTKTESGFEIRGMLPWHNFLSGPSAWNLEDYKKYLNELQKEGINFLGFHNYTGGGERYATYVEPMIKIQYKNILPEAYFDNSSTARWGYTPMKTEDFAFNTSSLFEGRSRTGIFGADCSILSSSKDERYENAQKLMREVMDIAHQKGIEVALGFEFGVHPPDYFSLKSDGEFYWAGQSNMIPNPVNYQSVEILYATLDDILTTYPAVDYIWLWLNEHSFMGVNLEQALNTSSFKSIYDKYNALFEEAGNEDAARFIGVWSLEYIMLAKEYLAKKKSEVKIIIGGWGGGNQLPSILKGLDKGLPGDIIFSLLNPSLGQEASPSFLEEIARNRKVISIPWLEGDNRLWQLQPRVGLMIDHVKLAKKMNLNGVAAIHWRTEEVELNFKTFARTARNPGDTSGVRDIYNEYLKENCGEIAAELLTNEFTEFDTCKWDTGVTEEYYAFVPAWGRKAPDVENKFERLSSLIDEAIAKTSDANHTSNLKWIKAKIVFELLLNEVCGKLEPAYKLRSEYFGSGKIPSNEEFEFAKQMFESAPIKNLFDVYAASVRSVGELGVLSSLNQKLWREYLELKKFLAYNKLLP